MFKPSIFVAACLLCSLCMAESASHHDHGHHNHGYQDHDDSHEVHEQKAHLHGLAELTLALEGDLLEINFESPAANIVGFEHKAMSDHQLSSVKKAKELLESPLELFVFNGANCKLKRAQADFSDLVSHEYAEEHQESGHHKHEHHSHHDAREAKEKDSLHNGESHSDVTASYVYSCSQGKKLKSLSVNLPKLFPGIETLKVMWLTDNGQGATELTSVSSEIRFK